jgi:hypothetical protein
MGTTKHPAPRSAAVPGTKQQPASPPVQVPQPYRPLPARQSVQPKMPPVYRAPATRSLPHTAIQPKGEKITRPKKQKHPRLDMTLVGQGRDAELLSEQNFEFYTATEREGFRIEADANGRVTLDRATGKVMPDGQYMFLMDKHGNIYLHPEGMGPTGKKAHHSSLSGGKRPSAAGELEVRGGKVVVLNNESGHYMPESSHTDLVKEELRSQGFDVSGVKIQIKTPQVAPYRVVKNRLTVRKLGGFPTVI